MALTRVQSVSAVDTTFASTKTTAGITTTTGNLILVAAEADTVAANGITITDSKSNSWTRVLSKSVLATFDLEIWYSVLTSGGSGHAFTTSDNGGGVDSIIIAEEWSGAASVSITDGSNSNSGTGSANTSGNVTTTNARDLLWVAAVEALGSNGYTLGSGYSNLTQNSSTFSNLASESQVVSSTGTYNGAITGSTGVSWACGMVAIKEAASTLTPLDWNAEAVDNARQIYRRAVVSY